jgi:hypothetical protein
MQRINFHISNVLRKYSSRPPLQRILRPLQRICLNHAAFFDADLLQTDPTREFIALTSKLTSNRLLETCHLAATRFRNSEAFSISNRPLP